jgi:hypothetical protein
VTWTLNSGRARGGPWNSQTIHHHSPEYRIAMAGDHPDRVLVGQQGPTEKEPNVVFGSYVYQPGLEEWVWDARSISVYRETTKTVDKPDPEEHSEK